MWIRLLGAALIVAMTGAAYAQFNRCGFGPCPAGVSGRGVLAPGSGTGGGGGCTPGGPTGQMDFSVCSNIAIIAAAMP